MPKGLLVLRENIERLRDVYSNDEVVLRIISQIPNIPFNFLQYLTKIPKGQLHRILSGLERYGLIRRCTVQRASFYQVIKEGKKN